MSEITIRRAPLPADHYMIVANEFMRGELPVPLKALPRVLLGYFLSLPSGWRITRERIDASVEEGREAVTNALGALDAAGYLRRSRRHGEGGTWVWVYAVTDNPIERPLTGPPSTGNPSMEPTSGNTANPQVAPSTGFPSTENPSIRKEDLSQKTEEKTTRSAAPASEPALPLPEVEDELAKRRAETTNKAPTLNQRAVVLAQAHYERLGKMGNVPSFMKIIRKALEHDYTDAQVDRACAWIADRQWTLTEEKLANALRGGPRPAGNTAPPPTTTRPQPTTGGAVIEGPAAY